MDDSSTYDILAYAEGVFAPRSVAAIRETVLTIRVRGRGAVSLLCTGKEPRYLTAGFLFTCGMIDGAGDIARLDIEENEAGIEARVELRGGPAPMAEAETGAAGAVTSGLGWTCRLGRDRLGSVAAPAGPFLEPEAVIGLARELEARSGLYRLTRGCHNASLCSGDRMLLFREDIGRHNAIDTIIGQCLLESIGTADKLILSTGRIASEIVQKAVRAGVPALASTAVATGLAVEAARRYGLALIGNIGESGLWVYNDNGSLRRSG
jgi:FdhD protein